MKYQLVEIGNDTFGVRRIKNKLFTKQIEFLSRNLTWFSQPEHILLYCVFTRKEAEKLFNDVTMLTSKKSGLLTVVWEEVL